MRARPLLTVAACLLVGFGPRLSALEREALRARDVPQARSLLGAPLFARADTGGAIARADARLGEAPQSVDEHIRAANARADAWRYNEAIAIYTRALAIDSSDSRLYRFRGHRYISLRRFEDAVRDLERGIALDSISYDLAYHLGLVYFLAGRYQDAVRVYDRCVAFSENKKWLAVEESRTLPAGYQSCMSMATKDDNRIAMTDWRYRALRRAGRHNEALKLLSTITPGMVAGTNISYYRALLIYKGINDASATLDSLADNPLQFATTGFGVANWYLAGGDTTHARPLIERIAALPYWPSFGVIASEVELVRLGATADGHKKQEEE